MKLIELMLAADVQWPVGAKWAVQDNDGASVKFGGGLKPILPTSSGIWRRDVEVARFPMRELASDWDTHAVTRDEYQAAGGWMKWQGGECPVDEDAVVQAKWSDGDETTRALSSSFSWFASVSLPNIVAYRIVRQHAPTHTIYHGGELYRDCQILLQTEQTLVWRCDGAEYCCKPRQALIDPDDNGLAAAILARLCGADVAPEHVREMREQMGWA